MGGGDRYKHSPNSVAFVSFSIRQNSNHNINDTFVGYRTSFAFSHFQCQMFTVGHIEYLPCRAPTVDCCCRYCCRCLMWWHVQRFVLMHLHICFSYLHVRELFRDAIASRVCSEKVATLHPRIVTHSFAVRYYRSKRANVVGMCVFVCVC